MKRVKDWYYRGYILNPIKKQHEWPLRLAYWYAILFWAWMGLFLVESTAMRLMTGVGFLVVTAVYVWLELRAIPLSRKIRSDE